MRWRAMQSKLCKFQATKDKHRPLNYARAAANKAPDGVEASRVVYLARRDSNLINDSSRRSDCTEQQPLLLLTANQLGYT
jgi:hypothetical protein